MIYSEFGKTGLKISRLGFGAMRLPMVGEGENKKVDREKAIPMIHRAFEAGVNYIDTATMYCESDSQSVVGEALDGWRDKTIVSTKNPYYEESEKEWWGNLENSLKCLRVDFIDIYHHHGVNWKSYTEKVEPRVSKWMRKAVSQGLVKHIACSFHDKPDALRKLIDTGYPEAITLQYNLLDRALEDGIAHAHEKGIGVVVMGPVAGGRLGADSAVFTSLVPGISRVPELALRFVLSNPNVTLALSGMSTMQHVEENVVTASDTSPLSPADRAAIDEQMKKLKVMADLYCTACGYCKPCPSGVDIPGVFGAYNAGRIYGLWEHARGHYKWMTGNNTAADKCGECGECEDKCPQHLEIRKQLAEAHAALKG